LELKNNRGEQNSVLITNNNIELKIGATPRLLINPSGNVGIGTASPQHILQLNNSGANQTLMSITNSTSGSGAEDGFHIGIGGSADAFVWNKENTHTAFGTNNTERMRITADGNVGIGTTSPTLGRLQILNDSGNTNLYIQTNGASWAFLNNHGNAGTQYFTDFRYNNTSIGSITGNNTSTSYTTTSDYRLKKDVKPMFNAIEKVKQLKPVTYKWKLDNSNSQGFIAHELQEVFPEAVVGKKDEIDEDKKPKYQGIDTSFLVATLVKAIQELKEELDELKAKVG
jgi:hypothetical protein